MKMLRVCFLLLMLANLVLFAWWQGYLAPWGPSSSREPQRLAAQVAPEKLQLRKPEPPPVGAVPAAEPDCHWVDGLKETEMKALLSAPPPLVGLELAALEAERPGGYEVAIPALANQAAAEAKQAEIKALGIEAPSAIAAEHDGHFRLVLARAADQAAAETALGKLKAQGVKSARVQALSAVKASRLQVHGSASAFAVLATRLSGLSAVSVSACEGN